MRVGVMLPFAASDGPGQLPTWSQLRTIATHAEAIGLDSVWVCDHFMSGPPGKPPEAIHEAWTILSALAATTTRIELGQLVMCTTFRHPGLLAKMAVTADSVSDGRIVLGLGAGWYDPEYVAFGYPTDHRGARFDEALQIIRLLLRGDQVSFAGQYHHLSDAILLPPATRDIPILVAGRRPRMLRLTARYADAWNTAWFGSPNDRLASQLADMNAALAAEGRDPSTLRRTVGMEVVDPDTPDAALLGSGSFTGGLDELARALDAYEQLGIDDLVVLLQPCTEKTLDRLARAVTMRQA